jgi:hypothetical protein
MSYEQRGLILDAPDDAIFDPEPETLATRLRASAAHGASELPPRRVLR